MTQAPAKKSLFSNAPTAEIPVIEHHPAVIVHAPVVQPGAEHKSAFKLITDHPAELPKADATAPVPEKVVPAPVP